MFKRKIILLVLITILITSLCFGYILNASINTSYIESFDGLTSLPNG